MLDSMTLLHMSSVSVTDFSVLFDLLFSAAHKL
jgi:hypothetical protein